MSRLALLVSCGLVAAAGCDRATGAPREAPEESTVVRLERADVVRYHMRLHLEDLRTIERRLVDGKLEQATMLATLLARPESDPGMAAWADATKELTDTANALAKATSIDEALRIEVRIAAACGRCHAQSTPSRPIFKAPGKPPRPDHASSTVRMVSHQWAADRLWEGLIASSDVHWRAGLGVISSTPLPYSPVTDAPLLAKGLQERANQALRDAPKATLDERARAYGEMLVTCAACHAKLKRR